MLGHRLYVGTLDAALISLDARTGLPMWEVQIADSTEGYTVTSPPLVVNDKVLVGISCGRIRHARVHRRVRRRKRQAALAVQHGAGTRRVRQRHMEGDSWRRGGTGAWLTGTYDPELNTVYWAMGNPAPQIDRFTRGELDNLFSCSVVALDPGTGLRKWHYQFTPNDGHDWDSVQDIMLVDRMCTARIASCCCMPTATVSSTCWTGRTARSCKARPSSIKPGTPASMPTAVRSWCRIPTPAPKAASWSIPRLEAGRNFQSPSYSATTGLFYLEYAEGGAQYTSATLNSSRAASTSAALQGAAPARRAGSSDPPPTSGIKRSTLRLEGQFGMSRRSRDH